MQSILGHGELCWGFALYELAEYGMHIDVLEGRYALMSVCLKLNFLSNRFTIWFGRLSHII